MLLLSTAYLAPVQYYAHLAKADEALIDIHEHYLKQTYRNRCIIAGPDGPVALSIPLEKASSHAEIRELRISDHGAWRHHHWNAIRSAYGHSPFFEYYADDFLPFYDKPAGFLIDYNEALQRLICSLLDIDTPTHFTTSFISPNQLQTDTASAPLADLRAAISPRCPFEVEPENIHSHFHPQPYYQVFQQRLGFLPNLSIIDLLFNMGPESLITLKNSMTT